MKTWLLIIAAAVLVCAAGISRVNAAGDRRLAAGEEMAASAPAFIGPEGGTWTR